MEMYEIVRTGELVLLFSTNMERLYSPEEVAELLGVKPETIRQWIRQKKLKAHKIQTLWRVSESDLQDFIKSGSKPAKKK